MYLLWLVLALLALPLHAETLPSDMEQFIQEMHKQHNLNTQELETLFSQVEIRGSILEAIRRPAEAKPWYQYRALFLTPTRIRQGVEFLEENRSTLERAEQQYGVPASIIVAILGVETHFGQRQGSYPVIDALSTLSFHYPPRSTFFRKELEQFLLLAHEEHWSPDKMRNLKGSYAGAMGPAQFMPSSYRHYAVDFNGDGSRNMLENIDDGIGSIANYLHVHGWQKDQPIAVAATLTQPLPSDVTVNQLKPTLPAEHYQQLGVKPAKPLPEHIQATLLQLDQDPEHHEYWLGFQNFYAITRYNHSPLYAMAVTQLAQAIDHAAQT